jgi:hypothetical protein
MDKGLSIILVLFVPNDWFVGFHIATAVIKDPVVRIQKYTTSTIIQALLIPCKIWSFLDIGNHLIIMLIYK